MGRMPGLPGGAAPAAVDAAVAALGERALRGEGLGSLTTYRVGGAAAVAVRVLDEEDLAAVSHARSASGLPVLVVGRGSNLLVADGGFGGIAVILDPDAFGEVTVSGTAVTASAAVPLPALARRTVEAGLTGLEWAVGVPGSVGGGVRMNAGGHGSEMARHLRHARVADLVHAPRTALVSLRPVVDLDYRYRHSSIVATDVVLAATFDLEEGDAEASREQMREIVRWRRQHQPGGQNAGSVFTNPDGPPLANSAGWLIDNAGLRGFRRGSAMVSTKHANFIQSEPGGSADDVAALITYVRERVAERFDVVLHTEVRLIGFPDHPSNPQLEV
jgi:UDP-N-acetylmuramate dehydrogenase